MTQRSWPSTRTAWRGHRPAQGTAQEEARGADKLTVTADVAARDPGHGRPHGDSPYLALSPNALHVNGGQIDASYVRANAAQTFEPAEKACANDKQEMTLYRGGDHGAAEPSGEGHASAGARELAGGAHLG